LACPVFIAHGRNDPIVPFEMSSRLAAARGSVVPYAVESEHNDLFEAGREELMHAVGRFIEAQRER
jgi:fermentation-respiration switch protein FrsA (DUF1100 family)